MQKRVLLFLKKHLASNPVDPRTKQLENPRWFDPEWGWARRARLDQIIRGLRCIFYVWEAKQEMIVVKFGTHADDVYEDGH